MTDMPRLTSVRLRGFKTFARPTELVFEPGVTVIIGPNGSGKSNIADAVQWVLGEQSPTNLRGRSMQDVIFSGPDGKRSSAVAEVSLVFDNEQGLMPVDGAEVEITRRLERDSASDYRVNGSPCRLLDIQDLIGALGIGREMHSVIGQGKVDALLSSTPEARRAMVEEAAGLGRFKKRRERAQAKLEKTRQNLVRMADIEREVKSALRPLRQQAAAAGRFAEAKEEWALAKGRYLLAQAVALREAASGSETELEALTQKRAAVEAELSGLRRDRAAEEDRFALALQERENVGAVYHRLAVEAEQVQGKAASLRQRVARIEADLERARRRLEASRADVGSLGGRSVQAATRTADETRLERVGGWSQALREALETATAEYRAEALAEDELRDAAFEMESARARVLQDREFLRREIEARQRIDHELSSMVEDMSVRIAALEGESAKYDKAVRVAEAAVQEAAALTQTAVTERDSARAEASEAASREAAATESLSGIEARLAVLEDLVARREGTSAGAREIMARSTAARLLAEVVAVETGYERAVAAALGPLAQAVVLEAPDDLRLALEGDEALEALVLEGGRSSESAGGPVPPGTRDLWEIVSGPVEVVRTLRALVPPTVVVVADVRLDLDHVSLSRGAYRVVNRRGEMLHQGTHVARRREVGAETLLKARNELQAAAADRSGAMAAQEQARADSLAAAESLELAEVRAREAQEGLHQAERALAGHNNDAELCSRRLEEARREVAELHAREEREGGLADRLGEQLAEAENKISAQEAELEAARAEVRAMQSRLEKSRATVAVLEQKKAQAGLVEVRLRERCRARQGERERVAAQLHAAMKAVEQWERRTGFLDRYLPLLSQMLIAAQNLAERGQAVKTAYEARLDEARAAAEGAARLMRDTAGSESGLSQQYEGLGARVTELRVERAHYEDRRAVLDEELAELRRRHMAPRSLTAVDVSGENLELLAAASERAERRVEKIGPINPLAEQECAELEERAGFLTEQRRDLEASIEELQQVVTDLDDHIEKSFAEIFEVVRENFSGVIATVFPGAKGSLKLVEGVLARADEGADGEDGDADEVLAEETKPAVKGISLEVKFANKSPRTLSLLSGGEKAMTAIAFLFSMFLARPCPFYILDEVEASLDDINIRRFLALVRRYRERTQFIIITHQRQTMEVADTLYGVTLESDGTSRILSRRLAAH